MKFGLGTHQPERGTQEHRGRHQQSVICAGYDSAGDLRCDQGCP